MSIPPPFALGLHILIAFPKLRPESTRAALPVRMDDRSMQVFIAYRSLHNGWLGPTTGGIRDHPGVTEDEGMALSSLMTRKTRLARLPCGVRGGVVASRAFCANPGPRAMAVLRGERQEPPLLARALEIRPRDGFVLVDAPAKLFEARRRLPERPERAPQTPARAQGGPTVPARRRGVTKAVFGSIAATLARMQRETAIAEGERACVRAALAEGLPPALARLRCKRQSLRLEAGTPRGGKR